MVNLLFVYGTLRSKFDNPWARLLRSEARFLGHRTMRGSIYRIRHYPGFRPDPEGEVHGELYRLYRPAATLRILDRYEGRDFKRVLWWGAWIYVYQHKPADSRRIASGDFCVP